MLHLGYQVSSCSCLNKSMAANTAATSSKKEAQTGKSGMTMKETSCHKLSKRDFSYFSSERFERTLHFLENQELAKEYGQLIALRKRGNNLSRAWQVVDAIIYVDILDAHYDGFNYSYEEVRDLFKGYRSQALREMKSTKGFNALVYKELAKALEDRSEIRCFLKAVNAPILREKCRF